MHDLLAHRSHAVNTGHTEMIRAVFCDEFEIGVDQNVLTTISCGDIGQWVSDLRFTGLFLPGEIEAIERQWNTDPAGLVAALMGGVDEVGRRRSAYQAPQVDVVDRRFVG
ncbi:hypothetical protein HQ325_12825 [Rhodococcus sp. BP-349]|uniref:hypothetical protein n=1 Tax=unclassified Rhodococcus (in: high G+C Gram-positive bacteria) TaxID=192944 RepID=UPI001C9A99EF|nr:MULTISPECIES: hypothetical protein [unclassified Rhodococcus (in: high G+C Gram-positive bacteria)]MBY6539558.1 hypothetical protein [Rhodococcus sp. BP-363]MBY6544114.1 hypothetical protein [Rhodococcus sp. BP-369]MBY6563344.1 hypothetical protein [Rhodococcus sp. BP-370]MBY6577636.1 hypothetical protein [Rhodococcus sp. BP-364]MBY6586937.1 hypothetical protein [Rhodococcus sp. BP-358]